MDDKQLAVELKLCGEWHDAPIDSPIFAAAARLTALAEENERMRKALRQLAQCDLHDDNCASLEVASKRIRSLASTALSEVPR